MPIGAFLRNLIGAAPQSELDAASAALRSASDARTAADEMKTLVAEVRNGHIRTIEEAQAELARLSARVEAMPEMRAQLENFVQGLGRTMTTAADRLETVDDRIERLEQQARAQTEIIALSRTELDRQGRVIAGLEGQMKSLEEAVTRLAAIADRSASLVREVDDRRTRADSARRNERFIMIGALILILIVSFLR